MSLNSWCHHLCYTVESHIGVVLLLFNATEVVFVGLPRGPCGLPVETRLEGRELKFST